MKPIFDFIYGSQMSSIRPFAFNFLIQYKKDRDYYISAPLERNKKLKGVDHNLLAPELSVDWR